MAVSDIAFSRPFLAEVTWAKDLIVKIREAKIWSRPMGLVASTAAPDPMFVELAQRDLVLVPYAGGPGAFMSSPDAYNHNIASLIGYIEERRQQEIRSANEQIAEVATRKARGWSVGLTWPTGLPDAVARYLALRSLPIACYMQGDAKVGDPSAYDKNIATLNAYVLAVGAAYIG